MGEVIDLFGSREDKDPRRQKFDRVKGLLRQAINQKGEEPTHSISAGDEPELYGIPIDQLKDLAIDRELAVKKAGDQLRRGEIGMSEFKEAMAAALRISHTGRLTGEQRVDIAVEAQKRYEADFQ